MNKPNKSERITLRLKQAKRRSFVAGLCLITLFWSVLYLPNLRTLPSWYGDEVLTLDIGKALLKGEMANRALHCTFASFNYNYQPAFAYLVGLASSLTAGDILGGRLVSVLIALFTAGIGFWFLGRRFGYGCGLFLPCCCLDIPKPSFITAGFTPIPWWALASSPPPASS